MAIKTYSKGTKSTLSKNFKSTEFDCHGSDCCSTTLIDEALVKYIQQIRDNFGKAVIISSGYRCPTHNKNVGGATGSYHAKGQAADIYINGVAPAEIAKYAESIGIKGIGLYETSSDGYFVHVDTRTTKSFWYGQKQAKRETFGGAPKTYYYRIRKSWADASSQAGAYESLDGAKKKCDELGYTYGVYGEDGKEVYRPEAPKDDKFKKGDVISLIAGAKYTSGAAIPSWVIKSKLYVREVRSDGNLVFSTKSTGAITGVVNPSFAVPYGEASASTSTSFSSYIVQITADKLNVRAGAGTNYKINTVVKKNELYTIVSEKNGWGLLKSNAGWISLKYTKKIK